MKLDFLGTTRKNSKKKSISSLVLDSQYESFFDSITSLTAQMCRTPVALISLVDSDSVWIHSQSGLPELGCLPIKGMFFELPQESNCFEVTNGEINNFDQNHPIKIENQLATFYAGAWIKLPLGEMRGVLCILDVKPRKMTLRERKFLSGMANVIEKALITKKHFEKLTYHH